MQMDRDRQLSELEAICAMYPEPGAVVIDGLEDLHSECLADSISPHVPLAASADLSKASSPLSGRILLLCNTLEGRPIGISFLLPEGYPAAPPDIQVLCEGGRDVHDLLTGAVSESVDASCGSEAVLPALLALQDKYEQLRLAGSLSSSIKEDKAQPGLTDIPQGIETLSRKSIWFHHIKNTNKRKNIVGWARDLDIRGYSKPGFPGIVVCEGPSSSIEEYFARIKALKWQALAVRAEETDERGLAQQDVQLWHFQGPFKELQESEMDVLAAECKSVGLDYLFRAALKLP